MCFSKLWKSLLKFILTFFENRTLLNIFPKSDYSPNHFPSSTQDSDDISKPSQPYINFAGNTNDSSIFWAQLKILHKLGHK